MAAISDMVPPRWFTQDFIVRQHAAVAFVVDMLLGTDPAGYAGCGEAIAAMDLRPALGAIKAPTLVIAGAEDQAAPPWQGAMTASGITDARLRVIRGTSHLAPYQTPGPVTAAILSHLGVPEKLR
jgi:pimeloyl-ACP methyl ester carboxylesterase